MHAQLPLAFWSPWAIVLVSAFIVAFPLVPTVWFYSRTVERRTGGDGGTDAVLAGRSERTPFVLVGWIGIVLGIAVVIGVATPSRRSASPTTIRATRRAGRRSRPRTRRRAPS
jgi:hypothetical protein